MKFKLTILFLALFVSFGYSQENKSATEKTEVNKTKKKKKKKKKYKLPNIDLSNWKVTIPKGKPNGKPMEVSPPEIMDYANNEVLKKYMYNDSIKGALVFYAHPSVTTANTKYSRSELREQMVAGSNKVNWTFADGGTMKGKLKIADISRDKNGKYHKVIVMQIHGRLSNEQRDLIGQKDNNAPPMLKIYWKDGKIRVKTKKLKNLNVSETDILKKEAWIDEEGRTFKEEVGFKKFTLEVKISDGKMVVSLNNSEFFVYKDVHIKRWNVFENYFKAGNYFQSRDKGSFAKVNYYELTVKH